MEKLEQHKKNIKEHIETLINSNALEEAKNVIREYEKLVSNDVEIYSIKGVISIMEGNIDEAERVLKEGLVLDASNFDVLYNLGYLYQTNNNSELAIKYYKRALKNGENQETKDSVYEILKGLGIEESKEQIINEMKNFKKKLKGNIQSLIEQGSLEEAKELLKQYEEIVKDDIDVYSMKGVIAMMEGDMDEAESQLKIGLSLDTENFDLNYNLAYLYQSKESNEKAIEYYKKALINTNSEEDEKGVLELLSSLGVKESKEDIIPVDIRKKLKVVFFPYKVTMWDSLESVYKAFAKDKDCEVHVVPIPYYQLSQDKAIPTYEGERFPEDIPITHYNKYNIKEEKPDIVFVHNIYDQYNTITRVYEEYFTSNLKKYTDMLVYVPYHIPSFFPPHGRNATYNMPAIKNVDKVVLVGDFVKEAAIKDGILESKLLTLGSPKIDSMVNIFKKDSLYPIEWQEKLKGKIVYTLDTGCLYFVNDPFIKIEEITNILNITNMNKNTALIWRPHPLTRIAIMKYTPQLLNYYNNLIEYNIKGKNAIYRNVILDETDNYLQALNAADILISGNGSLLGAYLLTEKKIIFLDKEMPKGSVIPSNAFYYFYNENEPWYKLVQKINKGHDPLIKNRKGLASKIYKNTDGTCGEKVYQTIKEMVIKK